jgi:hypothetical protein
MQSIIILFENMIQTDFHFFLIWQQASCFKYAYKSEFGIFWLYLGIKGKRENELEFILN